MALQRAYIDQVGCRLFPICIISDSAPVLLGGHKTFLILSCIIFGVCVEKSRSQMLKVYSLNMRKQEVTRACLFLLFCHELVTEVCPWFPAFAVLLSFLSESWYPLALLTN